MSRSREQPSYPTIGDVAVAAGVSPATAARAIGGYGRVSAAVRARVLAEAERVGYRPNSLARSMITGTTHTIGVVIADIENPFFARAVRGIADTAHAAGYEVILTNSDERLETERAAVGVLYQKRVDGLIVAPASNTDAAPWSSWSAGSPWSSWTAACRPSRPMRWSSTVSVPPTGR
jgi:LacI family transcriptional regulator